MARRAISSSQRQGGAGHSSDWQIYRRLFGYVIPQWAIFVLSLLGYLIYSLGNVLLADLLQFLLDSLDDSVEVTSGIVSTVVYSLFDDWAQHPLWGRLATLVPRRRRGGLAG